MDKNWFHKLFINDVKEILGRNDGGGEEKRNAAPKLMARTATEITEEDLYEVTEIGPYAFYNWSSLQTITIPKSVKSIGRYAFGNCTALTGGVVIPEGAAVDTNYLFYKCSALQSITFPNGITSIAPWACYQCSKLESVNIPEGVTEIGEYAFEYCGSGQGGLKVSLPSTLKIIGKYAFDGRGIYVDFEFADNLTTIGDRAFYNACLPENVTLPSSITYLGTNAFSGAMGIKSINIPIGITTVPIALFYSCSSLESVTIPEGVTKIDTSAFGATTLSAVEIPSTVTTIGQEAFWYCRQLQYADFSKHTSIPTLGRAVFEQTPSTFEIRVPGALYDEWKAATNWADYASKIVPV
jgi:hypothetical protein